MVDPLDRTVHVGRLPAKTSYIAITLLALLCACSNSPSQTPDTTSTPDVEDWPWQDAYWEHWVPPEQCVSKHSRLLHSNSWPGRGIGIVVGITGEDGLPASGLQDADFTVQSVLEQDLPFSTAPVSVDREYLAVLYDPCSDSPTEDARVAVAEFIEQLPEHVEVAIYLALEATPQLAGFSTDRALALAWFIAESSKCADDGTMDLWDSVNITSLELERIGGPEFPALRTLVAFTSSTPAMPDDTFLANSALNIYLVFPEEIGIARTPFVEIPMTSGKEPEATTALLESMAKDREGLYGLGICPGPAEHETVSYSTPSSSTCVLPVPKGLKEEDALACSPEDVSTNRRTFPEVIRFHFDEEQREIFDVFVSKKSQDDFKLAIQLGKAEPVKADAHLRGQTSLDCKRKSFNVNLNKNRGRHILPESATDEFLLISMCKDDRYFQQYTANILAREMGLFPMRFGLVELFVEEETWGVYLLLEKTKEALLEDNSRVGTVLRRRFDPGDKLPEVKHPAGDTMDSPSALPYWQLLAAMEGLAGNELILETEGRMNLDQFLAFLAFQTLMGNGDYVDEMWLYSTQTVRAGEVRDWFSFMAWDMDDLFSKCHHSGKHAMEDPHDILYCAEGNLEKALLADPVVYARFIDILDKMMTEQVTAERVNEALQETESVLLPYFERPEICAVMDVLLKDNPEATDPEIAQADIKGHMDELRQQDQERRGKLAEKIQAYRDSLE